MLSNVKKTLKMLWAKKAVLDELKSSRTYCIVIFWNLYFHLLSNLKLSGEKTFADMWVKNLILKDKQSENAKNNVGLLNRNRIPTTPFRKNSVTESFKLIAHYVASLILYPLPYTLSFQNF